MKRNGFRNQFIALHPFVKLQIGARFALLCFAILTLNWVAVLFALFTPIIPLISQSLGLKPSFNKDGLTGDELKLVEKLEGRFNNLPDTPEKDTIVKEVRAAFKEMIGEDGKPLFDVAKLKEMLGDDDKGVRAILIKQGTEIGELKSKGAAVGEDLSIRAQVAAWQTRNKEAIGRIKAGERNVSLPTFEIRAANSPMLPSNTISDTITINAAHAIRQGAPVFDLRRVEPTFWDYIPKGRTSLETYPWVNKKVPAASGEAAWIGPGVAKPGISFTFEVEKSNAKKIAVSMKLATELLEDIDGMTTFIQVELAYQLKSKANTTLMTATDSSTVPGGVQTYSLGFTTSGISTTNPNNWDAARSVIAQMRAAFITGPIVIFMNPIDTANMDMDKAISSGTYLGTNVRPIPGGVIVEDNNVPVGFLQAIAIDALKTLIYKDFYMAFGWENDDFTKNLVTVIAEMRIHNFHSENDAAAFVYDEIADIKSQIAAA